MEKKYIIELPENTHWIQWLMEGTKDHHPYMDFKSVEDLTPYTEPDLEQVRKEAYEKGFDAGRTLNTGKYEKGLNDAWEAARKIVLDVIPLDALVKMFGNDPYSLIGKIFEVYSASEVVTRIKAWEEEQKEQKEIKVGDEVGYYGVADEHGNVCYSGVVLEIRKDDYLVMEKSGKTYQLKKKLVMSKTGHHFPEIATVLKKMCEVSRNENDYIHLR